jgi:hypothetical protein
MCKPVVDIKVSGMTVPFISIRNKAFSLYHPVLTYLAHCVPFQYVPGLKCSEREADHSLRSSIESKEIALK